MQFKNAHIVFFIISFLVLENGNVYALNSNVIDSG
jgi:hypothetical protein